MATKTAKRTSKKITKQRVVRHDANRRRKAAGPKTTSLQAGGSHIPSADVAVEVVFWVLFLTCVYNSGKYYWRVVFSVAASVRLLHMALWSSYACLPRPEPRFAAAVLLGMWLFAFLTYLLLIVYGVFISPLHIFIPSPMDAWKKYTADPEPLEDFRILHDPGPKTEIEVIAIHGLGSNPDTAWASTRGVSGKPVVWLRDLLPRHARLSKARIVQVNQQTRWDTAVSTLAFDSHAKNLFQILEAVHKAKGRPIIFIAHSFGGLLLKRALLLANQEVSSVGADTRGLLFLGVPHGGTVAAFYASILSCTAYWRGSSTTLLHYMEPGSEPIEVLERDFYAGFVRQRTHRQRRVLPRIVDFTEQRPERIGPLVLGKTVNYDNQGIHHGFEVNLDADHRGLNKFASEEDPNYRKVLDELVKTAEYAIERMSGVAIEVSPTDNVPFERDRKFVQRNNIVNDVCKRILASKDHLRLGMTGLGGMGKSQISIEVAYALREEDPNLWVFWVRAGTVTKFKDSYSVIAHTVGIASSDEPESSANLPSLARSWLRNKRKGRWLIILDGADDMGVFYPGDSGGEDSSAPRFLQWLPRVAHGSILITTRNRGVAINLIGSQRESSAIYTIDSMNLKQAIQLLKSRVPEPLWDDEIAGEIVKELDYIPLAIGHAAAYIDYTADLLCEYLDKIRALRAPPMPTNEIHDSRRDEEASASVFATWRLSLDQIRASSETAAELLCLMSTFDNQNIPEFFIARPMALGYIDSLGEIDPVAQKYIQKYGTTAEEEERAPPRTDATDSLERGEVGGPGLRQQNSNLSEWLVQSDQRLRDDISLLYNYHMISIDKTRSPVTYSMHGLVQSAVTRWLEAGDDRTAYTLQEYRDRALIEVSMAFKLDGASDIYEAAALHQNAAKVLQYKVNRNVLGLHHAEILYHQARYRLANQEPQRAEECIKQTIAIRRSYSAGYTLPVIKALELHGDICYAVGEHARAVDIYRDALEGWSLSMGFSPDLRDRLRVNLGASLGQIHRSGEGIELLHEAIRSSLTRMGADSYSVLEDQRVLAGLHLEKGDTDRAIDELRAVVAAWESHEAFERDEFECMTLARVELIVALRRAGRRDEAARLAESAIPVAQAELGVSHPTALRLQGSFASVLCALGRLEEAEAVYRERHVQCRLTMAPSHPYRQDALLHTVLILSAQSKDTDIVALVDEEPAGLGSPPAEAVVERDYWRCMMLYAYGRQMEGKTTNARAVCQAALGRLGELSAHKDYEFVSVFELKLATRLCRLELYEESISYLNKVREWCEWREGGEDMKREYAETREKAMDGLKKGADGT